MVGQCRCIISASCILGGLKCPQMHMFVIDRDCRIEPTVPSGYALEARGVVAVLPFRSAILSNAGKSKILGSIVKLVPVPVVNSHSFGLLHHHYFVHEDGESGAD